jgi:hypothetical protein
MNVEIGTEAAQFPEKEYINGICLAVYEYHTVILWKNEKVLFTFLLKLSCIFNTSMGFCYLSSYKVTSWRTIC